MLGEEVHSFTQYLTSNVEFYFIPDWVYPSDVSQVSEKAVETGSSGTD